MISSFLVIINRLIIEMISNFLDFNILDLIAYHGEHQDLPVSFFYNLNVGV
jgi:hypothetical protein